MQVQPRCTAAARAAVLTVVLAASALPVLPALAADAVVGKTRAAICSGCHGPMGLSVMPDAPNLAGQPAMYITEQLKAYRSGARKHEVMSLMAKPLSDADIDNLAAWFGSIEVQLKTP